MPTADVLSGLGAVIDFYTAAGAPVVLPTPAYMPFLDFPRSTGRDVIEVPMIHGPNGWAMDLEGIESALADHGGLVVLCNPHNPTGKMYSRSELQGLARVVERQQAKVFADEIHASITFDGREHIPYASLGPATAAHTITATSASKTFNIPGLECAQSLFANPQDRLAWLERGFYISHGASIPGRIATIAAYDLDSLGASRWCHPCTRTANCSMGSWLIDDRRFPGIFPMELIWRGWMSRAWVSEAMHSNSCWIRPGWHWSPGSSAARGSRTSCG